MKIIASAGAVALAAGLLVACGGGGGGDSVPAPSSNVAGSDVPIAATQDPNAAFSFVASFATKPSDSTEPLTVGNAALATSDTEEPKSL